MVGSVRSLRLNRWSANGHGAVGSWGSTATARSRRAGEIALYANLHPLDDTDAKQVQPLLQHGARIEAQQQSLIAQGLF